MAIDRSLNILVIEDNNADFLLLERFLRQHDVPIAAIRRVDSDADLSAALKADWDVVLSDFNVPGMDFRVSLSRIPNLISGMLYTFKLQLGTKLMKQPHAFNSG